MATSNNAETEKRAGEAGTSGDAQAPRRKKNIIRVYHAQNASDGGRSHKKPEGARRQRPASPSGAKQADAADKAARPVSEKAAAQSDIAKPAQTPAAREMPPVRAEKPSQAEGTVKAADKNVSPENKPAAAAKPAAGTPDSKSAPAAKPAAAAAESKPASAAKPAVGTVENKPAAGSSAAVENRPAPAAKPAAAAAETKPAAAAKPAAATAENKPASAAKPAAAAAESKPAASEKPASGPAQSKPAAAEKPAAGTAEARSAAPAKPAAENGSGQAASAARPSSNAGAPQGTAQNRPAAGNGTSRPAGQGAPRTAQGAARPAQGPARPAGTRSAADGQTSRQSDRRFADRPGQGTRTARPSDARSSQRPSDAGANRAPRTDAGRTARPGFDNRGGQRFGQNARPAGAGQAASGRGENRFGQGSRPGARPGQASARRGADAFASEMGKSNKDTRRERERDNKNHKKDFDKTAPANGRRPNQNGTKQGGAKAGARGTKPVSRPAVREEKKPEIREITIPEKLTIRELAEAMKMQPAAIVKKLFMQGEMVTVNQEIDFEKAQEIALEFEIIAEKEVQVDVIEELLKEDEEDESRMVPRPPVVCVMGHVDHGKTSLLDYIRNSHVTKGEAGGITQHIGAYVVNVNGQRITFLDTPGHEAFTAMRMRGANATDIAVLVVAADDGVMPQTIEAISHAKAAGVEIIVAINKIDKPSANIERVKQELSEYELIPEDWGGSTPMVPVSAHTGEGIDDLLEMILLTAEVSELKADPDRAVRGLVIEAKLDKGKGPVATILVQKGTLHQGDFIAAGSCHGKVRAMMDAAGNRLKDAGPSTPVEILGLGDVPGAGEVLMSFPNDKDAKAFAETFVAENKKHLLEETKGKLSLDNLFDQIQASDLKELPLIVKADVQGSVEAVRTSLLKLSNEEVIVKVIHGGVGAINESDVSLAATSNAIIIGFNVKPDNTAKQLAEQEGVDMRLYRVIYQAIEDVEAAMRGMLDPVYEEKVIGHAQVRQLFKASGVGTIAGSYVLDGIFQRGCKVRITHEGDQIYEGELASLKRFKDDVKEVRAGYECGLVFKDFNDVHEDDLIEAYIMVEVPR